MESLCGKKKRNLLLEIFNAVGKMPCGEETSASKEMGVIEHTRCPGLAKGEDKNMSSERRKEASRKASSDLWADSQFPQIASILEDVCVTSSGSFDRPWSPQV